MSGFRRLSKVTGKMYLVMFLAALLCMLINTVYICVDSSHVHVGESVESKITSDINTAKQQSPDSSYALSEQGLDLSEGIYNKMDEVFGFLAAMAGIIFLLFMREVTYTDIKSREFEQTLPVKKTTLVMHEYWFFFIMISVVTLLQGLILAVFQSHYNDVWVRISGLQAPMGFNSIPMEKLMIYIVGYLFTLLLGYTWIYLGMTLCKNSLLGGAVSIGTWIGSYFIYENSGYGIADLIMNIFVGRYPGTIGSYGELIPYDAMAADIWERKRICIDELVEIIVNPKYKFYYLSDVLGSNLKGFEKMGIYRGIDSDLYEVVSPELVIGIAILILVLGIVLIWLSAKVRQLSKGGRFSYFTAVEYLFALCCGAIWYMFLTEYVAYDIHVSAGFVVFSTLVVTAFIALLIHPVNIGSKLSYRAKQGAFVKCFTGKAGANGELRKMLYKDGGRLLLTLFAGIIMAYVHVSRIFNEFQVTYIEDYREQGSYVSIPNYKEIGALIIANFHGSIICIIMLVLLVSKLVIYWTERKGSTREFFETFPVRRGNKAVFSIVGDMIVTIIPIIFAGVYVYIKTASVLAADDIVFQWLAGSMAGIIITDITYIVMLVGLLHFIEEMFSNGMLRFVGFCGIILMVCLGLSSLLVTYTNVTLFHFLYGVFVIALAGGSYPVIEEWGLIYAHDYIKVPVLYKGELLSYEDPYYDNLAYSSYSFCKFYDFSNPSTYIGFAAFYLMVGVLFTVIAYRMAKRKDMSSNGFNFEFGKYVFAAALSITAFCITQPYVVAVWHRILIMTACIILFAVLIYLMNKYSNMGVESTV